jgi:hypothetical protein
METAPLPRYRQPRVLYAVGIACIVLGVLILLRSRVDPATLGATATVTVRATPMEMEMGMDAAESAAPRGRARHYPPDARRTGISNAPVARPRPAVAEGGRERAVQIDGSRSAYKATSTAPILGRVRRCRKSQNLPRGQVSRR